MNSLVVQTLIAGTEAFALDRWFDAVFDALAKRSVADSLPWRVAVGDVSGTGAIDDEMASRWSKRARADGGSLTVTAVSASLPSIEAHRALALEAREALVMVLEPGVVVLGSTIERLIAAHVADGAAAARVLPIEDADAARCVLWSATALREAADTVVVPGYCPEAVVWCDPMLDPSAIAEPRHVASEGSLLEVAASAVDAAREAVSYALSVDTLEMHSIVMRTQAQRAEPLRDALLCLSGQSDGRFEVLLVVHDGDLTSVEAVVSDQPRWLRARVKVLSASGGTRARPLNVGIRAARGTVVSFLDDDDLVFGNWVSSVLEGARRFPHRVTRAVVGVQSVGATLWRGEIEGHVAQSDVEWPYPKRFNLADHYRVNMTPFMAFAFPRSFFDVFGGADEELEVCEDWDLGLRAAATLGVSDLDAVAAIYRRWTSGKDSYTVHQADVWERDMARVRSKCDELPLILPPGSASELAELSLLRATKPAPPPPPPTFSQSLQAWLTAPFRVPIRLARGRLSARS